MGLKAIEARGKEIDGQARRGWLEKGDVLDTRPWSELEKLFRRT